MKVFDQVTRVIYKVVKYILFVCLAIMLPVLLAQVLLRYFAGYNILWSDELGRYLHVFLTLIGAAILVRDNSHVKLTLVEEVIPEKGRKIFFLVRELAIIAFAILVFYYSLGNMAVGSLSVSTAMRIPMQIIYGMFPVTMALMFVNAVFNFLAVLLNYPDKDKPLEEEETSG